VSIGEVHIAGYRSIGNLRFPLRQVTVLVGPNGVGKTNLYRALELLHAAATGTFAEQLAREGGLDSAFSAMGRSTNPERPDDSMYRAEGRRKHEKNRIVLEVGLDGTPEGSDSTYRLDCGFPIPDAAAFPREAQLKAETLTLRGRRPVLLLERQNNSAWARGPDGGRVLADDRLLASETALASLRGYPEIQDVRQTLAAWRFFHGFRTDADSPLRRPALAVTAPLLAPDGSNLAAVFATLRHIREDSRDLDDALDTAFPGVRLDVPEPDRYASFTLTFPDMPRRPFAASELSDGTLQFLALAGALLSYRLPPFIALNEPEASLHPDLLPTVARLIARAAQRCQIWVVTHSQPLADALARETGAIPRRLLRGDDGTSIEGLTRLGTFLDE